MFGPQKAHIGPLWTQKIEILNFELEEKLDHHSDVEFRGESNGDGLEAQKQFLGPKKAHLHHGPKNRNMKPGARGKVRRPF